MSTVQPNIFKNGCSSCCQTNNVKALKAGIYYYKRTSYIAAVIWSKTRAQMFLHCGCSLNSIIDKVQESYSMFETPDVTDVAYYIQCLCTNNVNLQFANYHLSFSNEFSNCSNSRLLISSTSSSTWSNSTRQFMSTEMLLWTGFLPN